MQAAHVHYRPQVKRMSNTQPYLQQTSLILCPPEVLDLVLQEEV
jgi:hypothetical protein